MTDQQEQETTGGIPAQATQQATPPAPGPWADYLAAAQRLDADRRAASAAASELQATATAAHKEFADVRARLLALPGIGPWTADYVAMRALGDPDVFLPTDIGVRRALTARGDDPSLAARQAEGWRPWRSYGLMHLWSTLDLRPAPGTTPDTVKEN